MGAKKVYPCSSKICNIVKKTPFPLYVFSLKIEFYSKPTHKNFKSAKKLQRTGQIGFGPSQYFNAKIRKKLFLILALRKKKPWELGRVNHDV